jgi:hypothetical protein
MCLVTIATEAQSINGRVIDELFQPMASVNVVLLNRTDSAFITGAVTKDDGTFSMETNKKEGLLKVSNIGYITRYIDARQGNVGDIQMQPDTYTIKGVQVNGERIIVKSENGHLTYNMPQLLEILPADDAYEALTRIPGVVETDGNLTFSGRPVTLIINGKATTLDADKVVSRLKSTHGY